MKEFVSCLHCRYGPHVYQEQYIFAIEILETLRNDDPYYWHPRPSMSPKPAGMKGAKKGKGAPPAPKPKPTVKGQMIVHKRPKQPQQDILSTGVGGCGKSRVV